MKAIIARSRMLSLTLSLALAPTLANAADAGTPAPSAYRNVMQAQYSASAPAETPTPEELKRIYDAYLKSIGHSTKDSNSDAGNGAGTPPR